jgi:malate dehydrogenase
MRQVAIIGAGELGGAVAHVLARRDLVHSVVLIDDTGRVAAGKALDLMQAAAVEGFATDLAASTDVAAASGADLVILADGVGTGEWQGDAGLLLLTRLSQMAPRAVLLCAGAAQRELVDRGVRELHLSRLFGSAPEALAAGARALVALAVNGSPRDVSVSVLGVPPAHTVIPWEDATVAGFSLTRQLDEPTRRRLGARIAALWPPGPYALASAAALVVEVMSGRSRRIVSCFVAPDGSAGTATRTAAMPVRLGAAGVAEVERPTLSVIDRLALDNAVQL